MFRLTFTAWLVGASAWALAVPAPRQTPAEPHPIVGTWEIRGGWWQQTTFRANGTCESPSFGAGTWFAEDAIYFGERGDEMRYRLQIDFESQTGIVEYVNRDGTLGHPVGLRFRKLKD